MFAAEESPLPAPARLHPIGNRNSSFFIRHSPFANGSHPGTISANQLPITGEQPRRSSYWLSSMNKKLIASVSVAVMAGILLLWTVLRHSPFGTTHNFGNDAIAIILSVLALPMRLYVIFVSGENGHWSLPILILLLALSGLLWGLAVERVVWLFSYWKNNH